MAHLRARNLEGVIRKDLKFWPVCSLLGPRQCGKSTLLRDLLFKKSESTYVNLDRIAVREAAQSNPELFLSQLSQEPIIIDEAHKAPALFDEIKAILEQNRNSRVID